MYRPLYYLYTEGVISNEQFIYFELSSPVVVDGSTMVHPFNTWSIKQIPQTLQLREVTNYWQHRKNEDCGAASPVEETKHPLNDPQAINLSMKKKQNQYT